MQSMTGFGRAAESFEEMDVTIEMRTVNGRYLDLNVRLPKEISLWEPAIRKEIQGRLNRGRVDVYVNVTLKSSDQYELNSALVENYREVAEQIRGQGLTGALDTVSLLQLPGVLTPRPFDYSSQSLQDGILQVLRRALDEVVTARNREGATLEQDLYSRVQTLETIVEKISAATGQIRDFYRDKLKARIQELTETRQVDENRLAQEIIFYAERSDATEEITRLRSHLQRFREYLQQSQQQNVGKNLDFLCQEMNREMNTILSKSPLAQISETGVEGKVEIEKIREQVQNVE